MSTPASKNVIEHFMACIPSTTLLCWIQDQSSMEDCSSEEITNDFIQHAIKYMVEELEKSKIMIPAYDKGEYRTHIIRGLLANPAVPISMCGKLYCLEG